MRLPGCYLFEGNVSFPKDGECFNDLAFLADITSYLLKWNGQIQGRNW